MTKITSKKLARAGIIASLYVVLSLVTFGFSSGAIQLRLSEGLTILPLIFPEAIPALFVGCMLSNLISGCALIDIFLGAFVTLMAGFATYVIGKIVPNIGLRLFLGGLFPVIFNAFLLPLIWKYCYGLEYAYIVQACFLLASQAISVYAVGVPINLSVERLRKKGAKFLE